MTITRVRIYVVTIGGRHPVLVQVVTDTGPTGVGEAGIAYGAGATDAPTVTLIGGRIDGDAT